MSDIKLDLLRTHLKQAERRIAEEIQRIHELCKPSEIRVEIARHTLKQRWHTYPPEGTEGWRTEITPGRIHFSCDIQVEISPWPAN
jgi:hypothetical protein